MLTPFRARIASRIAAGLWALAGITTGLSAAETKDGDKGGESVLSKVFGAWTGWQDNATLHGITFQRAKTDQRGFVIGYLAADTAIAGRPCRQGWVHLHPNGIPAGYTAAADIPLSRLTIPAGTWVFQDDKGTLTVCSFPRDMKIQNHDCRGGIGGSEGVQTAFYPSGALKQFFAPKAVEIEGFPCRASAFQPGIELYEDGRLKSATLDKDIVRDGHVLHGGDRVRLTPQGSLQQAH